MNSHNQVRGHRAGSSHSGAEEYPREKTQTKSNVVHAYITADAFHASARNMIQSHIGSQPTMCQVHTGANDSLLAPGKTDYTACHQRKTTTYILDVAPITTHTQVRRKSIGERKRRKDKKRKGKKKRTDKTRGRKERKVGTYRTRYLIHPSYG